MVGEMAVELGEEHLFFSAKMCARFAIDCEQYCCNNVVRM